MVKSIMIQNAANMGKPRPLSRFPGAPRLAMHRQGPRERRVGGRAGSEWGGYILRAPGCSLAVKIRGLWVGTVEHVRASPSH